jgi:hypothetical protein
LKRIRSQLTYANVVSTLCLFLLLGGGAAYAASQLGKNSVGTKQLKNNAVTGAKVKNGSLTGGDLESSTLGRVPSAQIAVHADSAAHADSATHADSAAFADNAATAAGLTMRKIFYAPATASPASTPILSLGGLNLSASCSSGTVEIRVTSAVDHTHFSSQMWNAGGSGTGQPDGLHHDDFNTTSLDALDDGNAWGETSFTYTTPDGTIVNGQLSFDSSNLIIGGDIFNHTASCLVSGFAISTASS